MQGIISELSVSGVKILVIILLSYIFHKLCDSTASQYYQDRIDAGKTVPKVYDISHRLLPDLSKYNFVGDALVVIGMLPFLYGNVIAFNEFISYLLVIFIIRSLIVNITILPKDKSCTGPVGLTGGCWDKIFSGHFSTLFLATLIFYKYKIISSVPVLVGVNALNALVILLARNHYTVDIIVSIFVVLTVFQNNLKI